jgi:hypothetical protein
MLLHNSSASAFFGTRRQSETVPLIAMEVHEALGNLDASPQLLAIVANWFLDGDDEDTLQAIQRFNAPH